MKSEPCNNGVMLYDYMDNNTALYWECGKIYEITINNWQEKLKFRKSTQSRQWG